MARPVEGPGFFQPQGRQGLVTMSCSIYGMLLLERKRVLGANANATLYSSPDHAHGINEGELCFSTIERGPGVRQRGILTPQPSVWSDWSYLPKDKEVVFMGLGMVTTMPGLGAKHDLIALQTRGSGPALGCITSPIYAGQEVVWVEPPVTGQAGRVKNTITFTSHPDKVIRAGMASLDRGSDHLNPQNWPEALKACPTGLALTTLMSEQGSEAERRVLATKYLDWPAEDELTGQGFWVALGGAISAFMRQRVIGRAMNNCNPGDLMELCMG